MRVSARGDTLRIVERVAPPRAVTAVDREQAVRELTDRFGAGLRVEPEKIPQDMPYWSTFFLDALFRLWVERYRPPGGREPTAVVGSLRLLRRVPRGSEAPAHRPANAAAPQ